MGSQEKWGKRVRVMEGKRLPEGLEKEREIERRAEGWGVG